MMNKKFLALLLSVVVILTCTVAGTIAFLTDKTGPITNTFELGDFTYKLKLEPNKPSAAEVAMPEVQPANADTSDKADGKTTVAAASADFTLSDKPSTTGYRFEGWYYDAACTQEFEDVSGNTITLSYGDTHDADNAADVIDITLYAKWKQMDFMLSFDTQAANVQNPADKKVTFELPYGELPTVTRTGYIFNGWALNADGTNPINEDSIVAIASDHTAYAQWTPITYTVKYNNNVDPNNTSITQPTGSTADSIHTYDVSQKLTENGYSRTGYTFTGWNTRADGKGEDYSNGQTVLNLTSEPNGTVTLYAQWGVKSYVIRYHANGGKGTMQDQVIKYDAPTVLSKNLFTKDDHSFMGWALTPNGEVKYIDEQIVVNLLESGTLDLYAVWAQDSHTVHFDYNGGTGSPASKQFQNGKAYGQLPEYPVHPTEKVEGTDKVRTYLFTGWYTAPTGGTRVYPSDIANTTQDHTLYAQWQEAPSNQVITNMVVKNNPDDDKDGVVDDVYLDFTCTSSFEKFNIPLTKLIPGQQYKLTYTASNDASFGDYYKGYHSSVYGSYIVETSQLTGGRIDSETSTIPYYAKDILADWYDRIVPSGNLGIDDVATNDSLLQGPWNNRTITFTATKETMYWVWDFGLMQDNIQNNYNIKDIVLEPVAPKIDFGAGKFATANSAKITEKTNTDYTARFTIDGDGGCETYYWPITGLTPNATYTIKFDHQVSGVLYASTSYEYGCGISSKEPTTGSATMNGIGANWISTPQSKVYSNVGQLTSTTFTFTPSGDTVYWVWNMGGCSDNSNCTTALNITNFKVTHSGGKTITFHSGSSVQMLAMDAHDELDFTFDIDIDELGAFANDMPTAGKDFIMEFNPTEGYEMPETILVQIDGKDYVYTLDDLYAGDDDQGNALYMLWIPGSMLKNAESLYIEAKAVEIAAPESEPTEPSSEATEPSSEATEPSSEATDPSTEATDPSDETTEPSSEATEPNGEQDEEKILDKLIDMILGGGDKEDSTEPTESKPVETSAATEPSVAALETTAATETTVVTEPTTEKEAE